LVGVDVVGEAEDRLLVGGVPLQRDLDLAVLGLALEEDDLAMERLLRLVQMLDEVRDAALVLELRPAALPALVDELDPQAASEERGFPATPGEDRDAVCDVRDALGAGPEGEGR